jgi:hypothetical protein
MANVKENGRQKRVRTKKTRVPKTQKNKKTKKTKKTKKGGMVSLPGTADDYLPRRMNTTNPSGPPMFAPYRGMELKNRRAMQLLQGTTTNPAASELSVSDSSFGQWMSKSDENIKVRKTNGKKTQTSKTAETAKATKAAKATKTKTRAKSASATMRNPKKTQKAKTRKTQSTSVWKSIVDFFT